ncbi:putative lipoprotein [Mycobacterium xenopi 4042]|uniref:Putative lipoprotein n=1 Tax=Mycobacterium xenopi 4042 TaxID=1299334 RepID=X8CFJ8_MYCXE|nr:putative lipoprotein [Mycobacterium xenopi 4042]
MKYVSPTSVMAAGPKGLLSPSCSSKSRAKIGGGLALGDRPERETTTVPGRPAANRVS